MPALLKQVSWTKSYFTLCPGAMLLLQCGVLEQGLNMSHYHRECSGSGRVFDSRRRGLGFEPHCVVSLSKNINPSLVLVQPRKTPPYITERLLMGRKESNQAKKNKTKPTWSGRDLTVGGSVTCFQKKTGCIKCQHDSHWHVCFDFTHIHVSTQIIIL